jgi:hypothetical protein
MIPEELKKYINELISQTLEEMDGATSTTASAGGEYNSKYAFAKKPRKFEGKTPTLAAGQSDISTYTKDGFTKVKPGMPSDSKIYDYKQFPAKPEPKRYKLYKEASKKPMVNVKLYESLKDMIKTELLNEISYRRFNENVSKVSVERKVARALNEVRKRIREIEQVIEYSNRLKTENTIKKESFWSSKTEQLEALSERLNQLSSKIRTLSQ